MMLTPWGPRAVPTGGAGVAEPAWSCTLTSAAIFFLGGMLLLFLLRGHDEAYVVRLCHQLLSLPAQGNLTIVLRPSRNAKSRSGAQTFWIWLKLSSTGVSRPKISTRAFTR